MKTLLQIIIIKHLNNLLFYIKIQMLQTKQNFSF